MIPGVPAHAAAKIMPLLAGGTTAAEAGAVLGVGKTKAHEYLVAFRNAGVAQLTGGGHASRWRLASSPDSKKPARSPRRETGPVAV